MYFYYSVTVKGAVEPIGDIEVYFKLRAAYPSHNPTDDMNMKDKPFKQNGKD